MKTYDLKERLILFGLAVSEIVELVKNTRLGNHIAGHLLRSGTSPSFNYGFDFWAVDCLCISIE